MRSEPKDVNEDVEDDDVNEDGEDDDNEDGEDNDDDEHHNDDDNNNGHVVLFLSTHIKNTVISHVYKTSAVSRTSLSTASVPP